MIDENKEQLRNLFRKYNVVDVQPAVSDKLPDDITTLQVCEAGTLKSHRLLQSFCVLMPLSTFSFSSTAGYYYFGCAAVPGRNLFRHNELALSQSVRVLQRSATF